jgi:hypothetical protein
MHVRDILSQIQSPSADPNERAELLTWAFAELAEMEREVSALRVDLCIEEMGN